MIGSLASAFCVVTSMVVTCAAPALGQKPARWPDECHPPIVAFVNLPVSRGFADTRARNGGIALRVTSGSNGSAISGGVAVLAADSLSFGTSRLSAITRAGIAVIRDVVPGDYWLGFSFIGYQPFMTKIMVPASRIDTLAATVHEVVTCLGR
jgi:hypothetical protein